VFRAQADWKFILPSELPRKVLHHLPRKMTPQAYQTSQYVVPRGGIFLGKWRSSLAGSSDGKMNVHSACALNILYNALVKNNKIFHNVVVQKLSFLLPIWEITGSNIGPDIVSRDRRFSGIPRPLQANERMMASLRYDRFIHHSFQFIIQGHPTTILFIDLTTHSVVR
jgi:hypothetical protein